MIRGLLRTMLVAALLAAVLPIASTSAEPIGDPAFERTWERTDRPVADGVVNRTWMWGPEGHTGAFMEPYVDAPGGKRLVQYFDKTRMEINDPSANPGSLWYVTNGLLAQELITGEMQTGDHTSTQRDPADVQFAGDPHPESPTYATFSNVLNSAPLSEGSTITQTIDKAGNVGESGSLATHGVTAANFVTETNHTVASVFWDFMNSSGTVYDEGQFVTDSLFENPFFAVGFPITEAYWVHVPVGGEWQDVLAQCFERRCLTYTPGNPEGWKVEAGNIGQHYHQWRYGEQPKPAPDPPADEPSDDENGDPSPGDGHVSFSDGTYVVGEDIQAGLYFANNTSDACYWERLSGFSGDLDDVIANSFGDYRQIVEIKASDSGFSSDGCGEWVLDADPIRDDPAAPFSDGVFLVGDEIAPGTWRSTGSGDSCYWARLDGFSGRLAEINANHFGNAGEVVEIQSTDAGFESSQCGTWERVGD